VLRPQSDEDRAGQVRGCAFSYSKEAGHDSCVVCGYGLDSEAPKAIRLAGTLCDSEQFTGQRSLRARPRDHQRGVDLVRRPTRTQVRGELRRQARVLQPVQQQRIQLHSGVAAGKRQERVGETASVAAGTGSGVSEKQDFRIALEKFLEQVVVID
jgi:hypothetical protein